MRLEFHHINFVSTDVNKMHEFYMDVLGLQNVPIANFPRPSETDEKGYSGEIKFATDGIMQMHLAERNLDVAHKHNKHINPVERGHIAFRTDDINSFIKLLDDRKIPYSDYGTTLQRNGIKSFFTTPKATL